MREEECILPTHCHILAPMPDVCYAPLLLIWRERGAALRALLPAAQRAASPAIPWRHHAMNTHFIPAPLLTVTLPIGNGC